MLKDGLHQIVNHGVLDLSGAYGFSDFVVNTLFTLGNSLTILNLNDIDPILTDDQALKILSSCFNLKSFSASDADITDNTGIIINFFKFIF